MINKIKMIFNKIISNKNKFLLVNISNINNLNKSKKLPKEWGEIKEVLIKTDTSPLHDWIPLIKHPIQTNINGKFRLEIFFVLLLDEPRYGPEFNLLAKVIVEFGMHPTMICESPILDVDARKMQEVFREVLGRQ